MQTQSITEVIDQAHQRLAELTLDKMAHDWTGRVTGTPLARPEQLPPEGDWFVWVYLAGRGAGKTRAAGEWVREQVRLGFTRIGMIAPTAGDARDVQVEGESGLLAVCHESDVDIHGNPLGRPDYQPSKRRLTWQNGAMATLYSAEEPSRLRGPQHEKLWCDEMAAWQYMREAWDMAMFGLRLGKKPQAVISTTPKPRALLRKIIADPTTAVTRGSTYSNFDNLSPHFIEMVKKEYEGTTLGRQELHAEMLDEAEGALWTRATIDNNRCAEAPDLPMVCVSIDPAVTATEESSETGIITVGTTTDRALGFVLDDSSGRHTPLTWAKIAIDNYHKFSADYILAEVNNGGDLVIQNIRNLDPNIPCRTVVARKGKYLRAEPVAAIYEQNRVKHVGNFDDLEDQMVSWEPLGDLPSPDRIDALVHGLTSLMIRTAGRSPSTIPPPRGIRLEHDIPGA